MTYKLKLEKKNCYIEMQGTRNLSKIRFMQVKVIEAVYIKYIYIFFVALKTTQIGRFKH